MLGIKPQEEACTQLTPQLASSFIDYMKAPRDDSALKAKYTQHLAIFGKSLIIMTSYIYFPPRNYNNLYTSEEVCVRTIVTIGNQKLPPALCEVDCSDIPLWDSTGGLGCNRPQG